MRFLHLFLVALLLTLTTACNRDGRLQGKWTFDFKYTVDQVDKPSSPTPSGKPAPANLTNSLTKVQALLLVGQLGGTTLEITPQEMRLIKKDGTGDSTPYQIIDRPTPDSWRIKNSDGSIETYTREGDRLWEVVPNGSGVKLYYKLAGK